MMDMENKYSMEKKSTFIWHALPVVGLLVWGALCITDNLWYDEAYSASMVSQSWMRLFYTSVVDDHSPFYYSILKIFYHLCGGGTQFWKMKLLSLLFMEGYLLLGKYYVKKLFGQQISVWFMLFSILMPIMGVQAGNVRMYAAALFFTTFMGLTAYDIYLDATRRKWRIFCVLSICTVYCHTFTMIQAFFFYLIFLAVLLYRKQFDKIKAFFICGGTVALVFSPWLAVTCRQMIQRMQYDTGSTAELATIYSFMDYCKEWFSALETPIGPVMFLGMGICLVLGYLAVDWMRAEHNYAPAAGMGALGLTVLAGGLVSAFMNNCFLGRYVFSGFGFLMLFYAAGMSRLKRKCWRAGILAVAACCFLAQYREEILLEYDDGLETYEAFWQEQVGEKDEIIASGPHTVFLSVYHPEHQYYIYPYKLYSLPFANTDSLYDRNRLNGEGALWYIAFAGDTPQFAREDYDYEEALAFHYMYYDFVIYRLTPSTTRTD